MVTELRTSQRRFGDVSVRLQESGPADARDAVVFVHGNPGSSDDFSQLMAGLGGSRRMLAPDMPGYGKSDRPADFDHTVEGYADFLGRILDETGIDRACLALHDFGGAWGLSWAAKNIERVNSVILFNIGLLPGYRWHKFARMWRTPVVGELNMLTMTKPVFRMLLNAENPKPFPADFIDRMYGYMDWPMKRGVLKLYRATPNPGEMAEHLSPVFKEKRLPALVIWGEADTYLPVRFAEVQKDYFNAEIHTLPNAGHWPMIDEPDEVQQLASSFLEKNSA